MSDTRSRIGAIQFAEAIRCGIHRVILEQEDLNRINVFPVADGDTGTNLSLSLGATLGALNGAGERVDKLLERVADALLDGARGNSGAIMAQFFQGLSDAAENLSEFTGATFMRAVALGSDYAHDAIADPQPGTILTVLAAFSDSLRQQVDRGEESIHQLLTASLDTARTALQQTESQLAALRKAGVVDAGAKGFVIMLEGVHDNLVRGISTQRPETAAVLDSGPLQTVGEETDLEYRFCTECMILGDDIDRRKLREMLSELGNSMVIAGTKRKARIHIHVNEPDTVFSTAARFGQVIGEKADDMQRQQHSSHESRAKFAVITDSAADIADEDLERLDIHMVPVRIQFGERGYLDKVSISSDEFFNELVNNPAHPTTSQPSPGDFRRQYQFLASHFEDVISISLTGAVSGTLQAAQTAALRVGERVHVFDTLNASSGQGLLAVFAAECAARGMDSDATIELLRRLKVQTRTFALVRDLSYAVRGGRIPGYVRKMADWLHVTPVLKTTPDGQVKAGGVLPGKTRQVERFSKYVAARPPAADALRISVAHALCEDDARLLVSLLRQRLPSIKHSTISDLGSSIGVHGGPGTIVVALQPHMEAELRQA